ncbi:MAG: hypothetical protein AABW51_04195 [Nanoarchaeota archaeon]
MKKENLFYSVIVLTIILVRLKVFLFPTHVQLFGVIIHYFWIGAIFLVLGYLVSKSYFYVKLLLISVGLGLFIDELAFMILGGGSFPQYWSIYSILGVVCLLLLSYLTRKDLWRFLEKAR